MSNEQDLRKKKGVKVLNTASEAIPVSITGAAGVNVGAKAVVAASVTSVTIRAAKADREQITVYNDSNQTLWLCYDGGAATLDNGFPLKKGERLIEGVYKGLITGIWEAGATGDAIIQEVSTT